MKATKVEGDSSLQKLIRMVQEAENKQALMQRIDDFSESNAPQLAAGSFIGL